ncbi:hypothetical protein [Nocardioides sp. Iso805N]|uniref:hypothetical protein n=1 Tax=Nocardioides sp. Iso805N TaxID=1283287 RepID=UPI0003699749|nr:hypothetical protein [Nocardioides sp. Iso805N]
MSGERVSGAPDPQPVQTVREPGTPSYLVHRVEEKDVTVDWFFGHHHAGTKIAQLVLVLVGWFFVILPVAITTSALVHRHDDMSGWWGYHEGFAMWTETMVFLGVLLVLFIVGFLVLHLLDRAGRRSQDRSKTYDEEVLALRLEVAEEWYGDKFGPADLRRQQDRVEIEPYGDVETYELRDLYRTFDIE